MGGASVNGSKPTGIEDRQLVISRHFDAPRELVFAAWTDPEHLPNWWGPRGFASRTKAVDLRPGGFWRYLMIGPDGTEYPNEIRYREITPPERIAYRHGTGSDDDEHFDVTVVFEPEDGGTRLTFTMTFQTREQREEAVTHGAIEGANQTFDRLAAHLGVESRDRKATTL